MKDIPDLGKLLHQGRNTASRGIPNLPGVDLAGIPLYVKGSSVEGDVPDQHPSRCRASGPILHDDYPYRPGGGELRAICGVHVYLDPLPGVIGACAPEVRHPNDTGPADNLRRREDQLINLLIEDAVEVPVLREGPALPRG